MIERTTCSSVKSQIYSPESSTKRSHNSHSITKHQRSSKGLSDLHHSHQNCSKLFNPSMQLTRLNLPYIINSEHGRGNIVATLHVWWNKRFRAASMTWPSSRTQGAQEAVWLCKSNVAFTDFRNYDEHPRKLRSSDMPNSKYKCVRLRIPWVGLYIPPYKLYARNSEGCTDFWTVMSATGSGSSIKHSQAKSMP